MPFLFRQFESLPEVVLIEREAFVDERGWFGETYKRSEFAAQGIAFDFLQDNHSYSRLKGTLRGLHFQREPAAQGKLVRCVAGEILDVAVDIRKGSPTFAKWVSARISSDNHAAIWVPRGFAHGILTMTDNSEVIYKLTSEYSADDERSIRWNDPSIGIGWPLSNPILSKKDAEAPLLNEVDNNYVWSAKQRPMRNLGQE
jgi:dTDP-4-dehydrorhamnose 3,5-epimerase